MTIIKTAQFDEHFGHDHEHSGHGSNIQQLVEDIAHGHEDVDPSDLDTQDSSDIHGGHGLSNDLVGDEGHDFEGMGGDMDGQEDFGDIGGPDQGGDFDFGDMSGNEGDGSIEIHLDSPNELGGDLPTDINIGEDAFQDDNDGFAHEGDMSDLGDPDEFNEMTFDGKMDGNVDFDETNDIFPDNQKHDSEGMDDFDISGLENDFSDLGDDLGDVAGDLGEDFNVNFDDMHNHN